MNALERIEVAVRTVVVNTLSLKYGDFWYLDIALFKQEQKNQSMSRCDLINTIKQEIDRD
jgi:abortive infection bacteriophage resistance protein